MICLDEMGPEAAKSHPGHAVIPPDPTRARRVRATQEIDYGRRGKGYVFGAFVPATGEAFTQPYPRRTIVNWLDFLEQVDGWVDAGAARVYAILDNLSTHRALDVLLWAIAHPRWEFVFPPTYAASLNLIEPWWKVLRSLALKGRRFETWTDIARRSNGPRHIGTPTATRLSGDAGDGIDRLAVRALASSHPSHELAG